MKILVGIKRVVDYNVQVRIKSDGSGVDLSNVKMSMNPFDEIAVEQAVRLKEQGLAEEVILVSIGVAKNEEVLRAGLAMGADRAILIETDAQDDVDIEPLNVAKLLSEIVNEESPELVLLGKQAIDNDMNATGQMLAALLEWNQATFVSELQVADNLIQVVREVDQGLQAVELTLPAVVTCDLRLNEPRYPSLPNIMKAKKKPLNKVSVASLNVDITPRLEVLKTVEPLARQSGEIVSSVQELTDKLTASGVI